MGSGSFSVPVLSALVGGGRDLTPPVETVGVVSQPDRPAGRGRRATANPVTALARELGIHVLQPVRLRAPDALESLAAARPDVIVVAAYGQILPRAALDIPPHGCLNLHPSLLPRHRGPAPVVGTLLAGDPQTGTTLMLMSPKMDAGPIISQVETAVAEGETAGELETRLAVLSGSLLLQDLPEWVAGGLTPAAQNQDAATYTRLLGKADARIDWTQPAEEVDRRIRGFDPWPVAHCQWGGRSVRLFRSRARAGDAEPGRVLGIEGRVLAVGTGRGVVLIGELQLPGGRRLPAVDVVRGYPALLGARLE